MLQAPGSMVNDWHEQEQRILTVIGNEDVEWGEAIRFWYRHLLAHLELPCEVTGIEDFQWEEFYIFGLGDKAYELAICRDGWKLLARYCPGIS
jgi:hypothetical protein